MLQVFRRHSYSWGTRVLLLLLGGVFALFFGSWGAASYFTRVRPAAQVGCYSYLHLFSMPGCQTITPEQIDSATIDLRREIQNMYGEESAQMLQGINLRQTALQQLIDQTLINRQAAPDLPYEELSRQNMFICGSPETCIRQVEAYQSSGLDQLLCLMNPYKISHKNVMRTIELFGKHIIPAFN